MPERPATENTGKPDTALPFEKPEPHYNPTEGLFYLVCYECGYKFHIGYEVAAASGFVIKCTCCGEEGKIDHEVAKASGGAGRPNGSERDREPAG